MGSILGIGIGAGLVSALLFMVVAKATPLALALYFLAPLPVMIVALGWSHRTGLVAAATGAIALALVASPVVGLVFAAMFALPGWWLSYLALLGRPGASGTEWYPLGNLVAWIAVAAAVALVASAVITTDGYQAFQEQTRTSLRRFVEAESPALGGKLSDGDAAALVERLLRIAPALGAQLFFCLLAFYLWAASRIVGLSGRLPRPKPFVPSLLMPRGVLALLVGAIALGFLPNYLGMLAVAATGTLCLAFAFQGLAAIHDRTRGRSDRRMLLIGLYLLVALTNGLALVALMILGVLETAVGWRRPAAPAPA